MHGCHATRRIALLAVCLLLTVIFGVAPASVSAANCVQHSEPFVQLNESYGEVRYIENATGAQIRRLQRGQGVALAGWEPIGLTHAELGLGVAVSTRSEQLSDGRFCTVLAAVEATVGYEMIDVYILRKYQRGSCQYGVILNHEREHVVIFQSTLNEYIPRLRTLLERTASAIRPIRSRDRHKAAERMRNDMRDSVRSLLSEVSDVLDYRNARLDTPKAYREQQRQCPSW